MSIEPGPRVGIVHYSGPPAVGGVERVMRAHARLFAQAGFSTSILAGDAEARAMPPGVNLVRIPEMGSSHPSIESMSSDLEQGRVPDGFEVMVEHLTGLLLPGLRGMDAVIVHNVFNTPFNLPLTAALARLLDADALRNCIAWCHDLSWTNPRSKNAATRGYPWDLLRIRRTDISYVAISRRRQADLADLLGCPSEAIRVIYSGVDASELLGLSDVVQDLAARLHLWDSDFNLIMPVRITPPKNIELAARVAAALKARGCHFRILVTGPPDLHGPAGMEYFQDLTDLTERLRIAQELRFVFASGPIPRQALLIEASVVAELMRICDGVFLPSHSEGFGLPVLEAGMLGTAIFCSDTVPAAKELAGADILTFSPDAPPEQIAGLIVGQFGASGATPWRQRVRRELTWENIFRREILPLLEGTRR